MVTETPSKTPLTALVTLPASCNLVASHEPSGFLSDRSVQFPKSHPDPPSNWLRTFFAMRIRWTSSGPSASRSVRAP